MKSSSASSAQWMSSNTSTVGPSSANASTNLRHAANASTRPPHRRSHRLQPDQRPQMPRHPLAIPLIDHHPCHRLGELLLGYVAGVGLQDAGLRLDHLTQRPERDALAIGQATVPAAT